MFGRTRAAIAAIALGLTTLALVLAGCGSGNPLPSEAETFKGVLTSLQYRDVIVSEDTETETEQVRKRVNGRTVTTPSPVAKRKVLEGLARVPGFMKCQVELERDKSALSALFILDEVVLRDGTEVDVELDFNRPTPLQVANFLRQDSRFLAVCLGV